MGMAGRGKDKGDTLDAEAPRVSARQELIHRTRPAAEYVAQSKAELLQDIWVLTQLSYKRNGYFVEFGAGNGINLSNTWLLEKYFGWSGILAEPNPMYAASLKRSRTAHISFECVDSHTRPGTKFRCTRRPELSRMASFAPDDEHEAAGNRDHYQEITVSSISLCDLLDRYAAPEDIDYLSIDTEGSEYEILREFDFSRWKFACISVEHNYTRHRSRVRDLLERAGYRNVMSDISLYDDWFVRM